MVVVCWSLKGGVGTTVVSAAIALEACRRGENPLLVDLAGDLPAVLGVDGTGSGIVDWCSATGGAGTEALDGLAIDVPGGARVVGRGSAEWGSADPNRLATLVEHLGERTETVVVDAGDIWTSLPPGGPPPALVDPLLDLASRSVLVTRACYLALRRVGRQVRRPSEVVLVVEPGRALDRADVEAVVGAAVSTQVLVDPAVARAVDSGLLARRAPRSLLRAVGAAR
ncbi:MAG: hypothetical protein ISR43_03545 [Acidimicrobiia bacterium]|nr:hypothetical protein [Actinomycetota bacterium]MBL6924130.1 hypothetical protein [Acidimicrobiia bacterium]MBL6926286.1 hypothetical protein [Acidimicrobiia bacterium]